MNCFIKTLAFTTKYSFGNPIRKKYSIVKNKTNSCIYQAGQFDKLTSIRLNTYIIFTLFFIVEASQENHKRHKRKKQKPQEPTEGMLTVRTLYFNHGAHGKFNVVLQTRGVPGHSLALSPSPECC